MLHWLGAKTRRSDLCSTLVLVAESTAKPCRAPEWSSGRRGAKTAVGCMQRRSPGGPPHIKNSECRTGLRWGSAMF
ncbi:hypothetical protein EDB86DRAFT_2891380 [Lactarius hatsudake]|nr:hypothetical protein EDB86DRAFT_2891380 [Lactarius hatsudake]